MTQPQNARKQRARPAARKGGGRNNSSNNGPGNRSENRSRGNPKQLLEKYKNQAREALQAGDRVGAEYFFQFADHYQRLVNEMPAANPNRGSDNNRGDNNRGGNNENGDSNNNRNRRDHGRRRPDQNGARHANAAPKPESDVAQDTDKAPEQSAKVHEQPVPVAKEKPAVAKPVVSDGAKEAAVQEKPKRRPRAKKADKVDPADAPQPTEVHPELNLDADKAEVVEKPKRKAPVRRKRTVKADVETAKTPPKGDEAA